MPLRQTKASTLIRSFSCERFGCYLVGLSVPHLKELFAGYAVKAAFASPNIEKLANEVNFMQNGNGSARLPTSLQQRNHTRRQGIP